MGAAVSFRADLEKSGVLERIDPAGEGGDLLLQLGVHAAPGFVDRGQHQVLEHLAVGALEHGRLDAHFEELLLPVHLHAHHAAARRGFHRQPLQPLLELLLHLLHPGGHLLAPGRTVPPKGRSGACPPALFPAPASPAALGGATLGFTFTGSPRTCETIFSSSVFCCLPSISLKERFSGVNHSVRLSGWRSQRLTLSTNDPRNFDWPKTAFLMDSTVAASTFDSEAGAGPGAGSSCGFAG